MPDRIIIVPYDPSWPMMFASLGAALRGALSPTALRIDHIGSTSIPGMAAKPIIDVQVSVVDFEPLDAIQVPLEHLGFVFRAANADLARRYFRESPGRQRTHIHVRRAGSWSEQFALLFRDFMRCHPDDARAYAALKTRLAEEYGDDRPGYSDAKSGFIWPTMRRADDWCQTTGWRPPACDA